MILSVVSGLVKLRKLLDHAFRMRGVMNHAERVDQIVWLSWDALGKMFGVGLDEADAVLEAEDLAPAAAPVRWIFRTDRRR